MTANLTAFMTMLAHSEGVDHVIDENGNPVDPYRVCFGKQHVIHDLAYHPAEHRPDGTIEWGGERLADAQCIALGLSPGCVSTAAGRYQIIRPTWLRLKAKLALRNFGPDAQDDACVQLLKDVGAFNLINAGRVAEAIPLCHSEWASIPGSQAGQRITPFAQLISAYGDAGGGFA
jgi:lysozyme